MDIVEGAARAHCGVLLAPPVLDYVRARVSAPCFRGGVMLAFQGLPRVAGKLVY